VCRRRRLPAAIRLPGTALHDLNGYDAARYDHHSHDHHSHDHHSHGHRDNAYRDHDRNDDITNHDDGAPAGLPASAVRGAHHRDGNDDDDDDRDDARHHLSAVPSAVPPRWALPDECSRRAADLLPAERDVPATAVPAALFTRQCLSGGAQVSLRGGRLAAKLFQPARAIG
jgi:hypothetical protein